ncbi:prophage protein [Acetobacter pasteurianus NBRC 101655]|uniref:DUF6978 family protein n=1 Tax=Acetobacter TaxID=434 RepID=UPI0002457348|nr:hypothetical protein [Acetobacter pasteurianus]BAU37869.1 prophage protein [Acetobacter pasteurianus NBRC 101655]
MSRFLSQAEAQALFEMEKRRQTDQLWQLPNAGGGLSVPLISTSATEAFHLDIRRSRMELRKGTVQNRARTNIVLARIDFGGSPHRNPDDEEIPCPHIHLYREGFGDRWAYPIDPEIFTDPTSHWQTLIDFMRFCNVIEPPNFERGLFS